LIEGLTGSGLDIAFNISSYFNKMNNLLSSKI